MGEEKEEEKAKTRRVFLASALQFSAGTGAALLVSPARGDAASLPPGESVSDGVGQTLRKAGAKIPGMGPPDVTYPDAMLGRWKVRRLLADVSFPNGEAASASRLAQQMLDQKGTVDVFTARFIQGKGGVVSDRDFNLKGLAKASENADVAVQWKSSNPNVLTVSYPIGTLRETKVTKRATTLDAQAQAVEWSEFSRIADLSTGGALEGRGEVPNISARWVRSRFKVIDDLHAEALTLEYVLPGASSDPSAASMKLKYRLMYERSPAAGTAESDDEEEGNGDDE